MTNTCINLGCGPVFVDAPDWVNLDFAPLCPSVRQANLLDRLPLPSNEARLVYSSHFLEHIPKSEVDAFLRECHRILKPGGLIRLVLPDLEEMARTYLALRESGDHERADFLVLEMIDQCVRRESGGELERCYRRLRAACDLHSGMIAFIRQRTGEDLRQISALHNLPAGGACSAPLPGRLLQWIRHRLHRVWLQLWIAGLPAAFRAQNVSLAGVGERHHWLWDFHQLRSALKSVGFGEVQRCTADSSAMEDFPFYPLDLDAEDRPRKGADSMVVEARKPF